MILIIAAMDEEVQALTKISLHPRTFAFRDISVTVACIEDKEVLIAKSGIGKANAAYTTTLLADHFHPSFVINTGSAGGLLQGQGIGDVVVADFCRYHDLDIGPQTKEDARFAFFPDRNLIARTQKILEARSIAHHIGPIVTGDQFVEVNSHVYAHLKKWYPEAVCVEMEAAAIGSVCQRMEIPFVILRGISDLTFIKGNKIDFEMYLETASKSSAEICRDLVKG